jgi:hypothetical protein
MSKFKPSPSPSRYLFDIGSIEHSHDNPASKSYFGANTAPNFSRQYFWDASETIRTCRQAPLRMRSIILGTREWPQSNAFGMLKPKPISKSFYPFLIYESLNGMKRTRIIQGLWNPVPPPFPISHVTLACRSRGNGRQAVPNFNKNMRDSSRIKDIQGCVPQAIH